MRDNRRPFVRRTCQGASPPRAGCRIAGWSLPDAVNRSREAFIGQRIRPFNARMSVGLKPTIRQMHADLFFTHQTG